MWFPYTFHRFRPTTIQIIVNNLKEFVNKHPRIAAVYEY